MRAHHCKNAATFRQGVLGAGSKDDKANDFVQVGGLRCFCHVCVVCCCVCLLVTVRGSARVHECQLQCVGTLLYFHVFPRHQNREPGMITVASFQIHFFVFLCFEVLNTRARTHTRRIHQQHGQIALINTRTHINISLSCAWRSRAKVQ